MSDIRGRGRLRLTFEKTISKILEEGHVKNTGPPNGMYECEAKEVCRDRGV